MNSLIDDTSSKKIIFKLKDLNKFTTKGIFVNHWHVLYELKSEKDLKEIRTYLKKPSKFLTLYIIISDRHLASKLLHTRLPDNTVKLDIRYPNKILKTDYIYSILEKPIKSKALKLFIRNLDDNYEEYDQYLRILNNLKEDVITRDLVKANVPSLADYGIHDLIETLIYTKHKDKHIQALTDVLEEYSSTYVYKSLLNTFKDLITVKRLIMAGYLTGGINLEDEIKYIQEKEISKDPILSRSKTLDRYISYCADLSLKELMFIYLLLLKYTNPTESELYKIVTYIMLRNKIKINL